MKKFLPLCMSIFVATTLVTLASAPSAVAKDVTYGFNLLGPQATTNGTETIAVTGGGSFDKTAGTVVASGLFLITNNSNGSVVSAGTWRATAFDSFCSRGGATPGEQGGVLVITVTLSPKGGAPPARGPDRSQRSAVRGGLEEERLCLREFIEGRTEQSFCFVDRLNLPWPCARDCCDVSEVLDFGEAGFEVVERGG